MAIAAPIAVSAIPVSALVIPPPALWIRNAAVATVRVDPVKLLQHVGVRGKAVALLQERPAVWEQSAIP